MPEAPPALRALVETGVSLARRTTSGRVLFGRLAGVVHADLLPDRLREPVRAELEDALRATATPIAARTGEPTRRSAWGKAPGRALDDDPEEEPLSVSPSAQVHAGSFEDDPVAVKVARPGLAPQVRAELALLDVLGGPMGALFPALDVSGALRELRESALDELDLEHEADQQQRVRRALRRLEDLVVPEVHADLAGEAVLVTSRLAGTTLDEGTAGDPS